MPFQNKALPFQNKAQLNFSFLDGLGGAGGFCGGFGWGGGVLVGVPVHEGEGAFADAVGGEDAEEHGGDGG